MTGVSADLAAVRAAFAWAPAEFQRKPLAALDRVEAAWREAQKAEIGGEQSSPSAEVVCVVCNTPIEPYSRFFTDDGNPRHMLCDERTTGSSPQAATPDEELLRRRAWDDLVELHDSWKEKARKAELALVAAEAERDKAQSQLGGVHLALAEANVPRAADIDMPLYSEQHRVRMLAEDRDSWEDRARAAAHAIGAAEAAEERVGILEQALRDAKVDVMALAHDIFDPLARVGLAVETVERIDRALAATAEAGKRSDD